MTKCVRCEKLADKTIKLFDARDYCLPCYANERFISVSFQSAMAGIPDFVSRRNAK